jgi:hypothetical protein
MNKRPVKIRFAYTDAGKQGEKYGLTAHFRINGNWYEICTIKKCQDPNTGKAYTGSMRGYWIETLVVGNLINWLDLINPVNTLKEAKMNARKIVKTVVKDLQRITFI